MNKKRLCEEVAQKANAQKGTVDRVISAFVNVLRNAIIDGEEVQLTGLGTFYTKRCEAREWKNPKTNEPCTVPEHSKPMFRYSKTISDELRHKE